MVARLPVASDKACLYLRIVQAHGVGPVCIRRVVEHFGSIEAALGASIAALERVEGVGRQRAEAISKASNETAWQRELEAAASRDVHIICIDDDEYPRLLRHIPDPPACLYVRGRLEADDGLAMAIVGSRRFTRYGLEQAERFGSSLARTGFTVVSGMARGADGAAHRGALLAEGRTVAVLGCGLSHIYPSEHAELAERIVGSGAVVSELSMNTPPERKNFLPRNRIIAGMSLGVVVTECAQRSGALATARLATEYNREVFAVPGQADNALCYGSNALIRDGLAKLVMNIGDVLDGLGEVGQLLTQDSPEQSASPAPVQVARLNDKERAVCACIESKGTSLEEICTGSGLSAAAVASTLTMLQIKGLIVQRPGNIFATRGPSG